MRSFIRHWSLKNSEWVLKFDPWVGFRIGLQRITRAVADVVPHADTTTPSRTIDDVPMIAVAAAALMGVGGDLVGEAVVAADDRVRAQAGPRQEVGGLDHHALVVALLWHGTRRRRSPN